MPKTILVDPRLVWDSSSNQLIELCVKELRAFRYPVSDGQVEILNCVDWGQFASPHVAIRLGVVDEGTPTPANAPTVKVETAPSYPSTWNPLRATETLVVDESAISPIQGLRVRLVEDLACPALGSARILLLAVTDEGSTKVHTIIGVDADLFDNTGHWRDERVAKEYDRFLSTVNRTSRIETIPLAGHDELGSGADDQTRAAMRVSLEITRKQTKNRPSR